MEHIETHLEYIETHLEHIETHLEHIETHLSPHLFNTIQNNLFTECIQDLFLKDSTSKHVIPIASYNGCYGILTLKTILNSNIDGICPIVGNTYTELQQQLINTLVMNSVPWKVVVPQLSKNTFKESDVIEQQYIEQQQKVVTIFLKCDAAWYIFG